MIEPIPLRPAGPHPTPDELYHVSHSPGDADAARMLRHAAGCALCSAELARQEAFDQPEPMPAAALDAAWQRFNRGEPAASLIPVRLRRRQSRWTPALALAATLTTCVLGLGLWTIQREHSANDVERGAQAAEVTANWSPSGLLKAPPAEFVFPEPVDGPRRVKVFDTAQTYEWTSQPTFTDRIAFPEEQQRRIKPGTQYFWTVVGGPGEGTATQSFRINP